MKKLAWLLVMTAVLLRTQAADVFEQNRQLGRGVNIVGYDPIWKNFDQAHFKAKHFAALHEAGFQNVRINIHPFRYMQADKNWELPESWWKTLDWAVPLPARQRRPALRHRHDGRRLGWRPQQNRARLPR